MKLNTSGDKKYAKTQKSHRNKPISLELDDFRLLQNDSIPKEGGKTLRQMMDSSSTQSEGTLSLQDSRRALEMKGNGYADKPLSPTIAPKMKANATPHKALPKKRMESNVNGLNGPADTPSPPRCVAPKMKASATPQKALPKGSRSDSRSRSSEKSSCRLDASATRSTRTESGQTIQSKGSSSRKPSCSQETRGSLGTRRESGQTAQSRGARLGSGHTVQSTRSSQRGGGQLFTPPRRTTGAGNGHIPGSRSTREESKESARSNFSLGIKSSHKAAWKKPKKKHSPTGKLPWNSSPFESCQDLKSMDTKPLCEELSDLEMDELESINSMSITSPYSDGNASLASQFLTKERSERVVEAKTLEAPKNLSVMSIELQEKQNDSKEENDYPSVMSREASVSVEEKCRNPDGQTLPGKHSAGLSFFGASMSSLSQRSINPKKAKSRSRSPLRTPMAGGLKHFGSVKSLKGTMKETMPKVPSFQNIIAKVQEEVHLFESNPFSTWDADQIKMMLVRERIEVRGTARMSKKELANIALSCSKQKEIPPRPRMLTPYELAIYTVAVDIIQAAYFHYRARNIGVLCEREALNDPFLRDDLMMTGREDLTLKNRVPERISFYGVVQQVIDSARAEEVEGSGENKDQNGEGKEEEEVDEEVGVAPSIFEAKSLIDISSISEQRRLAGAMVDPFSDYKRPPIKGHSEKEKSPLEPVAERSDFPDNTPPSKKSSSSPGSTDMGSRTNLLNKPSKETFSEDGGMDSSATATDGKGHNGRSRKKRRRRRRKRGRDSSTMAAWVKPTEEAAEDYIKHNHPRQPDGNKHPLCHGTTTGRFCFLDGWGQQCDLWNEGMVSEFCQYGVGVTNYFKFIKWCGWTMSILSILSFPSLVINMHGEGYIVKNQLGELASTSYGNLGESINGSHIHIPFCDTMMYHGMDCMLDKYYLGQVFGYLDAIAICFVMLAGVWLKVFSIQEAALIDKHTVTVTDFSIYVPWVPRDTKEAELRSHFEMTTGFKVADVAVGRDQRKEIQFYRSIGRIYRKRQWLTHHTQYLRSLDPKSPEIKKELEDRVALGKEILSMMKKRRQFDFGKQAICAYVTFEDEDGMLEARKLFHTSAFNHVFMKKHLKFKNKRLKALPCPMPSTIMWENLGYNRKDRLWRTVQTGLLALSMITVSITVAFLSIEFEQKANSEVEYEACPGDWDNLPYDTKVEMVLEREPIIHCLCSEVNIIDVGPSHVCYDYIRYQTRTAFVIIFSSMIVVSVNAMMNIVFRYMGRLGMHRSIDDMEHSVFLNIFGLKFINTGLILLLVNSSYVVETFGLEIAASDDFNAEWYRSAGTSIILTLCMNIISPHFSPVGFMILLKMRYRQRKDKCITQDEFNRLTDGHNIKISTRYAELLTIFYVCFMFSAGLPILPIIGTASFFVFYWVDKYLFINFYRRPPTYSESLGLKVVSFLPYSVILHCFVAIWMLSNEVIFVPDEVRENYQEYMQLHEDANGYQVVTKMQSELVRPIVFILGGTTVVTLAKHLVRHFGTLILMALNFLTCSHRNSNQNKNNQSVDIDLEEGRDIDDSYGRSISPRSVSRTRTQTRQNEHFMTRKVGNVLDVQYSQALLRGILKGLNSYNILENPVYREAFAISESFAKKYHRVDDVNKMIAQRGSIMMLDKDMGRLLKNTGGLDQAQLNKRGRAGLFVPKDRFSAYSGGSSHLASVRSVEPDVTYSFEH